MHPVFFLASYADPPVRGLRLNGLKRGLEELERTCRAQFLLEEVPWAEEGFYVGEAYADRAEVRAGQV